MLTSFLVLSSNSSFEATADLGELFFPLLLRLGRLVRPPLAIELFHGLFPLLFVQMVEVGDCRVVCFTLLGADTLPGGLRELIIIALTTPVVTAAIAVIV